VLPENMPPPITTSAVTNKYIASDIDANLTHSGKRSSRALIMRW